MLGFKAELLRCLWCEKVVLLKHGVRTRGQKQQLHWSCEEWLMIYCRVLGGKDKGRCPKALSYAKEDFQATGGLAIVKLRLCSMSSPLPLANEDS